MNLLLHKHITHPLLRAVLLVPFEMLSLPSDTTVLYSVHVACFHVNLSLTCLPSSAYWNEPLLNEPLYIVLLVLRYNKVKSWEERLI